MPNGRGEKGNRELFDRIKFQRVFGFYPKKDGRVVDTATMTIIADPVDSRIVGAILRNMARGVQDRRDAASTMEDMYLSMSQDVLAEVLCDMKATLCRVRKQHEQAENILIRACQLAAKYGFYDAVPTYYQNFLRRSEQADSKAKSNEYGEIAEAAV